MWSSLGHGGLVGANTELMAKIKVIWLSLITRNSNNNKKRGVILIINNGAMYSREHLLYSLFGLERRLNKQYTSAFIGQTAFTM